MPALRACSVVGERRRHAQPANQAARSRPARAGPAGCGAGCPRGPTRRPGERGRAAPLRGGRPGPAAAETPRIRWTRYDSQSRVARSAQCASSTKITSGRASSARSTCTNASKTLRRSSSGGSAAGRGRFGDSDAELRQQPRRPPQATPPKAATGRETSPARTGGCRRARRGAQTAGRSLPRRSGLRAPGSQPAGCATTRATAAICRFPARP